MHFLRWLTKRQHDISVPDSRYASAVEVDEAFAGQREHLLWLAQVITGDGELALTCCVDARKLSAAGPGVFRDWLLQWARVATVRSAVECVRESIMVDAADYESHKCSHGGHGPFAVDEIETLAKLGVRTIVSGLDPFPRAVLVIRGVQGAAIQDCALMLGASRSAVVSAHCEALKWLHGAFEQKKSQAGEKSERNVTCMAASASASVSVSPQVYDVQVQ